MSKTSTNLDIVKYIYNELEEPNKNKITIQSLIDDKTKSQIESLNGIKDYLDNFCLEPSEETINKIKACSIQNRKSEYFA